MSRSEDHILAEIKQLAVVDVAATVRVTDMLHLKQAAGEPIRAFVARVRGKANTISIKKQCSHTPPVDVNFADELVRWVVLAGLSSPDIYREVMGTDGIDDKSLSDTITIIENKERAARATLGDNSRPSASETAAVSQYKSDKKKPPPQQQNTTGTGGTGAEEKVNCEKCGKLTAKSGRNRFGRLVVYKLCRNCFTAGKVKKGGREASNETTTHLLPWRRPATTTYSASLAQSH